MHATSAATGPRTTREAVGHAPGDGIELAWGCWPGAGVPVVALHGITASYMSFVGIGHVLHGRRPLLAFDLRGRGGSGTTGPFGMAQHARDVAAAMDSFALDRCVVVGHSMGAFVAVALAAERPDLVAALVLVDGGLPLDVLPGMDPEEMLDVALAAQMARLRATYASLDDYLSFWRGLAPFSGGRWNAWVEAYLTYDLGGQPPRLRPKASEDAVRGDFRDTLGGDVLRTRLRSLDVPVTLLRATEGFEPGQPPLFGDELVAREGAHVPQLVDEVVPDTTHYTIALGQAGAVAVADHIVAAAEAVGR